MVSDYFPGSIKEWTVLKNFKIPQADVETSHMHHFMTSAYNMVLPAGDECAPVYIVYITWSATSRKPFAEASLTGRR